MASASVESSAPPEKRRKAKGDTKCYSTCTVQSLLEALKSETSQTPLDVPALEMATIEFPSIVVPHFVEILDSHAIELSERICAHPRGHRISDPPHHGLAGGFAIRILEQARGLSG